ncbi:MAG: DUF5752 family protein [Candidatus Omnitrophota bacterium]|jgi:hypothetical protein|nr:DUF5752 family protein [Candidatus Omnitrophota bacterium]MDD5137960.1 DUF5752 family protein [Candidatus Omnitrophota bacterium]MDD5537949.1 DUF5752 family protein [Candidatus Omnitrophota bacterium]
MTEAIKAKEPFRFYTRWHLSELLGIKASNLGQLLEHIKNVPGSCIYHHTHRFLQQHQYLSPEPPNDFAYWVRGVLGDDELGERLASIDTIQYKTIRSLREKIVETIEEYLKDNPRANLRFAREDEQFHFIKSVSFIAPTNDTATDLREFAEALKKVTIDSIYFHIFEAHLRLEKGTNDFSNWLETSLQENGLAAKIARLDPYTYTLDGLRKTILKIVEKRLAA